MSCADLVPSPYFAANCGWRIRSCRHASGFNLRQSHLSANSGRRERSRAQANPLNMSHRVKCAASSGLSARIRSHFQTFSSVCSGSVDGSEVFIFNSISLYRPGIDLKAIPLYTGSLTAREASETLRGSTSPRPVSPSGRARRRKRRRRPDS